MEKVLKSLGPVTAVIGAQWGDEGKGKIIDILAEHYDIIARACGGANAGHTIVVNGKKHVFRLLPSGSLHAGKQIVLGAGMVIHLPTLLEEIDFLDKLGVPILHRLHISSAAHIVFDFHKDIDGVLEVRRAQIKGEGIGTTKRGIGPAYMDKAARLGIRFEALNGDLRQELTDRVKEVKDFYGVTIDLEKELKQVEDAATKILDRVTDVPAYLHDCIQKKHKVLIEGAQATMLDIDHGTYPFVTSSSTTLAGALQGLGFAPKHVTSCIGVAKAYCTRVGSGTFPTQVEGTTGDRLRERGGEYGSVTGRPRRCGWLSIPDLQRSALLNGFDCWNITKMDVLDEEDEIPVSIKEENGKPTYKTFPGWKTSTASITSFKDLPKKAQDLLTFIEKETDIPVRFIGTGRGREEMVVR